MDWNNNFDSIKSKVATGPFSFFRFSTVDTAGLIKSYPGNDEFTVDPDMQVRLLIP